MLEQDTVLQGRYRILSQIGKGGMGTVYIARDENIGMTVAVKQNVFEEARLIEAFKREARLLAGLRHPALAQVKDYFIDGSGQYLVMDYIPGDDLGTLLQKRKQAMALENEDSPFEVEDVVRWAEQLLDALDYLHTRSEPVIHRDIKPLNLKLGERGQIILLDFGLAKGKPLWMTRVTSTGSLYGYTPNYAPIEQIRGLGTDPRSDLYALGATLYHLMTGEQPTDAATRAESFLGGEPDPLLPPNRLNPKVPKGISSLLMKALEPHRNNRPSCAAEMLRMLRTARHSTVIEWQPWQMEEEQGHEERSEQSVLVEDQPVDVNRTTELASYDRSNESSGDAQFKKKQPPPPIEHTEALEKNWEAELRARQEAERRAKEEAERKAKEEAERKARDEAERKAKEEAERKAKEEAERKAKEEAERKAKEETERRAREEAARRAREEAERKAKEEAERKAREEAERKAKEEAERHRRQQYEDERLKRQAAILRLQKELEESDSKAKQESELTARQEAERKAKEEAERKAREEAERKARDEAQRKAKEEAQRKAKEEAERKAREKADRDAREQVARRRRQYEEERLKRIAEIQRLQKEQEEVDRQEGERLRAQSQPTDGTKDRPSPEKSRKQELVGQVRKFALEQPRLWIEKVKPQTRTGAAANVGTQEEQTRAGRDKERARRLYAGLGIAAVVVLALSTIVIVSTSKRIRDAGSDTASDQTTESVLSPGVFTTPSRVLKVALSDDGRVLASVGPETTVRVWRSSGARELPGQTKRCRTAAVSPDGMVIASGTEDGSIRLWRSTDGAVLKSWRGHIDYVMSLSFSADGQTLYSAGADRSIRSLRLWRVTDGGLVTNVNTSGNDLIVAVGTRRKVVGLGRQDGGVHMFYLSGDLLVPASDVKATPVSCAEFSNDGQTIALGDNDGQVGLWRVNNGSLVKALGKFNNRVASLAFNGNGQTLAAGFADGAIRLWRASDGVLIKTLVGHEKSVNSVSLSVDGRTLASGGDDKTVRVWSVEKPQE